MDRMYFVYIGFIPMFVFYMLAAFKKLRSNRVLIIFAVIAFLFAIPGILIKTPEAGVLAGSFAYVVIYSVFRYLYLKKYGIEPTYNRASWYDPEDGRRQNWFDVVVFVIPLLLSLVIAVVLVIAKAKKMI